MWGHWNVALAGLVLVGGACGRVAFDPTSDGATAGSGDDAPPGIPLVAPRSIATSFAVDCAVLEDGSLWCWGSSDTHSLGSAVTDPIARPTRVGSDVDWVEVSVDAQHACARKQDGSLWCWGTNVNASLGSTTPEYAVEPVHLPGADDWRAIAVGTGTCGLHADGTLTCYGMSSQTPTVAIEPVPGVKFRALSVGHDLSVFSNVGCAITDASEVWCWTTGASGDFISALQMPGLWQEVAADSFGWTGVRADGTLWRNLPNGNALRQLSTMTGWAELSLGSSIGCAMRGSDRWCWGENKYGQYGDGAAIPTSSADPVLVESAADVSLVTVSVLHTCARRAGTLMCTGNGSLGQLGDGVLRWSRHSTLPGTWSRIDATSDLFIALASDHSLAAWGSTSTSLTPSRGASAPQVFTSNVRDASAAPTGVVFVRDDGTLWRWGEDFTFGDHPAPELVDGATDWDRVDVGSTHACAVRADGTAWCYGRNAFGQLGDGSQTDRTTPVRAGTATYTAIAASEVTSCGIQTDASLWCWGLGMVASQPSPVLVAGGAWSALSVGLGPLCAVKSTGELYCGQFGATFTQLGTAAWRTVSTSGDHTCGVQLDGTLWCWGMNDSQQIGGSTDAYVVSPFRVGTRSDWVDSVAIQGATCARTTAGTVECWGEPTLLGDGLASSSSFVTVAH